MMTIGHKAQLVSTAELHHRFLKEGYRDRYHRKVCVVLINTGKAYY